MSIRLSLLCLILLNTILVQSSSSSVSINDYPELTDDEYSQLEWSYHQSDIEPSEKKYLELSVKPHLFDLNKDNKLSKPEMKKAILYALFPSDAKKKMDMGKEAEEHIKNHVDLFLAKIEPNYLNYKQFAKLAMGLDPKNFINVEILYNREKAKRVRLNHRLIYN